MTMTVIENDSRSNADEEQQREKGGPEKPKGKKRHYHHGLWVAEANQYGKYVLIRVR